MSSLRVAALTALLATLVACSGSATPGVPSEAYVAALTPFLPDPAPEGDDRPVVFVAVTGEHPIGLEAQVAIVDAVAEHYDLRFVDDFEAALDDAGDDPAPVEDGRLLAIGTIQADAPHIVRVEDYLDAERSTAHIVTLVERSGRWSVASVERVEPEVLVGEG
jgi:hypothetical protein